MTGINCDFYDENGDVDLFDGTFCVWLFTFF